MVFLDPPRADLLLDPAIHSFLEMLPLMAAGFISVLRWPALRALVGLARDPDPHHSSQGRSFADTLCGGHSGCRRGL